MDYQPDSVGRQIASMAVSGDHHPRLATIKIPVLVIDRGGGFTVRPGM
ncbi:hypothetical protein ACIQ6U_09040 [Lysinibacillus fusiformis]